MDVIVLYPNHVNLMSCLVSFERLSAQLYVLASAVHNNKLVADGLPP